MQNADIMHHPEVVKDGAEDGITEVGIEEGAALDTKDGAADGTEVETEIGTDEGTTVGAEDGAEEGAEEEITVAT